MIKTRYLLFTIITFLVLWSCGTNTEQKQSTTWPAFTTYNEAGFEKEKLEALTQFIEDSVHTTGLVVIYDGKMLYQYGDIEDISYLASCRKSILAILYGKYVENGTINLDQTIGSLGVDEDDGLLDIEKQATVDDIITSRSGVFHLPSNGGYDEDNILERGSVQPGEYWVYNNWDFNVAGYLFEQAAGRSIYEELETQLAIPLGFEDWDLDKQKKYNNQQNSRFDAYHLYLSTRDMARVGQFMLNEGKWNNEQLVSKAWLDKIITPVTPEDTVTKRLGSSPGIPQFSYSYMWWPFEELNGNEIYKGSYTASGYGGQLITVIPEMKLVIAHKTNLNREPKHGRKNNFTSSRHYWYIVDQIVNAKK